jgi:hypothetical protein
MGQFTHFTHADLLEFNTPSGVAYNEGVCGHPQFRRR